MENISLEGKTNFLEKRIGKYQRLGIVHPDCCLLNELKVCSYLLITFLLHKRKVSYLKCLKKKRKGSAVCASSCLLSLFNLFLPTQSLKGKHSF